MQTQEHTHQQAFFRPKSACTYLDIGRTKLYELMEYDANFPRPVRLGVRCIGWTRSQLDQWLEAKVQEAGA